MSSKPTPARLTDTAFDGGADADVILDAEGKLAAANGVARRLFNLSDATIGTPLQDLELSYRPVELRQSLDEARRERRPAALRNVPWTSNGQARHVDVILTPLLEDATLVGVRITFSDVSLLKRLQDELTQSRQEVETAYEELQSTNEELETTNEELQSTVEELETTNEELQSTNEELETMNEELQSTNEELQTMNDELRNRTSDVTTSNTFLESVFNSVGSVVVVLDRDLRVDVWNAGARDMWGLRSDEARKANFFNLDFGLPVAELHQPIRDAIHDPEGTKEVTIAATNRKGRRIDCRVRISPLRQPDGTTTGVILLMQDSTAASPGV